MYHSIIVNLISDDGCAEVFFQRDQARACRARAHSFYRILRRDRDVETDTAHSGATVFQKSGR